MKNLRYYGITLLAAFACSSCNDFLDEKYHGKIFPETYPANVENLESLVTGLYAKSNEMYFKTGMYTICMGGDDATTLAGGNKSSFLEFDIFSGQDNNANIRDIWKYNYDVVKQSNNIMVTIDGITSSTLTAEALANVKNRALGQAHFMRAQAYFNLVRSFGQVPLVTNLDADYNLEKAEFADIYGLIVDDLLKAEDLLPDTYSAASNLTTLETNTAYARITSGAAKSLLSSVYLTMAGYPLKDTSCYAKAAAKAKEVIDNEQAYGYTLLPIDELWSWKNGWKNTGNAEGVFTCYFNTWSDWTGEGSNGNTHAMGLTPSGMSGWDDAFAEIAFYNEFPEGPRKEATFITDIVTDNGAKVTHYTEFTSKHPHYRKYVEMEGTDWQNMGNYIDWWSCRTIPVIRYAEVLLVYAEAQAMAESTPNDLAYKCLNRVRQRAGLEDAPSGLSGTAFAQAVITERKWEFAGLEPNARWYDLVRTETVAAANAKRDAQEVALTSTPNDTTHDHYFAPIPQHDTQLNPNL